MFEHSIGRVMHRWGIARPRKEVWEVEYAYLPPEFLYHGKGSLHPEWTTVPMGTFSYVDKHDLALDVHHARAR